MNQREVVVVIGAGGIGQAIGRRQGTGRTVLLADLNEQTLDNVAETLISAASDVWRDPLLTAIQHRQREILVRLPIRGRYRARATTSATRALCWFA